MLKQFCVHALLFFPGAYIEEAIVINQKILMVDDEPLFLKSLTSLFEQRGLGTLTSSNGLEAIETFKSSPVKVILTDILMPEMNGFEFLQRVKKIDPFVQLIFITGYADLENTKKALKMTAFDLFKKPIQDNNILFNAIEMAEARYGQLKNEHETHQENDKALSTIGKIFDSLEAIVYVSDMETYELLYTNKKFKSEFGYREDELFVNHKCWQIIQKELTGPCSFCTNSRIVDENGHPNSPYSWEFYNEKTQRYYWIIDKAIEWVDKRIVRLETAYDITETRKYEKLFKQYEKTHDNLKRLESLGTFAGGIAHQFNNALSVITGHLDLIEAKFPENSELKNHTRKMLVSSQKMTQLTTSLLAYARGGKYQTQTFLFSKFIRETLEHFKYELPAGINLILDFSEKDHYVKADKAQLQMLLSAVLENAFEAINKIGTIKLVCEPEEISPEEIGKSNIDNKKEYVCLTIIDDGPGINHEIKDKIFEPFVTTKFPGRGLGLSAAYGIVKNHHGFITIDSQLAKGTSVKVFLPIQAAPEPKPLISRFQPPEQALTILLVEDEYAVMRVVKMMLERMGHTVLEADTGEKALDLVKSHNSPIHLVLLDFFLPDKNGDVLYPLLMKERPEMETIVLSGYALTEPVQKILDAGARAFMQKPVTMAALSEQINQLGKRSHESDH